MSRNGLAYGVMVRLCKGISKQGCRIYFDNFYTGVQLLKDLFANTKFCVLWNPSYKAQGCDASPEGNQDLFQGPKRTDEVRETGSAVVFTVAGQQTCHSYITHL